MGSSHPLEASASGEAPQAPRALDELRTRVRRLGLAICTETAGVGWIRRFLGKL